MNYLAKKNNLGGNGRNETPEQCITQNRTNGVQTNCSRERSFRYFNGEITYFRQKVKFKAELLEEKTKNEKTRTLNSGIL